MNNFSILKYILLRFAAVILLNTNVAAEQYYFGVEGGYALYDNMDEERQYLTKHNARPSIAPLAVIVRAAVTHSVAHAFSRRDCL